MSAETLLSVRQLPKGSYPGLGEYEGRSSGDEGVTVIKDVDFLRDQVEKFRTGSLKDALDYLKECE